MKLFISGTNTDVGKTFITNNIAKALMQKNLIISIAKPIETGVVTIPQDSTLHMQNQSIKYNIEDICFYQFKIPASPFVADKKNTIDINHIKQKLENLEKKCDILIIEGAGGLFVPIKKDYFMIDLIKDLDAFCFLVASSKLGCINDIIISRMMLEKYHIDFISIVNIFNKNEFLEISYPYIKYLDRNFMYQMEKEKVINFICEIFKKN
ncbi:dethiobiotin synthase [Helicobacter sp. 16-1353]|uniref:dethiobiotin synthase n=1 Tax=Helicobacter sp. 16-1353 TaxID=2004996 RepID=UPI000DCC6F89|nr:dethiobiotin synthase [Helicobacter sp. 16-1353]RAX51782.1 dethiobiotin synthase [Helicobacter sp. 16-1353]